jgi:hypothetical protein
MREPLKTGLRQGGSAAYSKKTEIKESQSVTSLVFVIIGLVFLVAIIVIAIWSAFQ